MSVSSCNRSFGLLLLTCLLSLPVQTVSAQVTVSWKAPSKNTDGSALTDLKSYTIKYRDKNSKSTDLTEINNIKAPPYTFSDLAIGTYIVQVHAEDTNGNLSSRSNRIEISVDTDSEPAPNPSPTPTPGDGTPGSDKDQDGVNDDVDNCPDKFNPKQRDRNNDGIGDACQDGNEDDQSVLAKVLNFDGDIDQISEWGIHSVLKDKKAEDKLIHNIAYLEDFDDEIEYFGTESSVPAHGDYDGDNITDLAYVEPKQKGGKTKLSWNVQRSSDNTSDTFIFGKLGDTVIANCQFDLDKQADPTVLAGKALVIRSSAFNKLIRVPVKRVYRPKAIACGDLSNDGADEIYMLANRLKRGRRSLYLLGINPVTKKIFIEEPIKGAVSKFLVAVEPGENGLYSIAYLQRSKEQRGKLQPVLVNIDGSKVEVPINISRFKELTHIRTYSSNDKPVGGLLYLKSKTLGWFNFSDLNEETLHVDDLFSAPSEEKTGRWQLMNAQKVIKTKIKTKK